MDVNGVIATRSGKDIEIVGLTGNDLECEGCEEKTNALYETADSVMLCKGCYDALVKDYATI
jgi:hypothetical protein